MFRMLFRTVLMGATLMVAACSGGSDAELFVEAVDYVACLLYTSPSPRDQRGSRMPSSA